MLNRTLAIANRGIDQILYLAGEAEDERPTRFELDGHAFELTHLEDLLDLPSERRGSGERRQQAGAVLLVQTEAGRRAVRVDALLDSRDLVIKPLGPYLPRLAGMAGATILGSGEVSPVLDLPELLRRPERAAGRQARRHEPPDTRFKALVVDDSLSTRRALVRVLEDAGYAVRGARDGLEAVEILQGFQADVLLVDMEMPRMNGTSRSTAKHRQQAQAAGVDAYFTKPVAEDAVLDTVTDLLSATAPRRNHR